MNFPMQGRKPLRKSFPQRQDCGQSGLCCVLGWVSEWGWEAGGAWGGEESKGPGQLAVEYGRSDAA